MRRGSILAALLPLALLLGACNGCTTPGAAYVAADRATYEAITPYYLVKVEADPELTEAQKARRKRLVETWRLRLEKAEEAVGHE